ncbi:MAG: glycosyltransferase family 39 protein [Candidatus Levybacteria bacterium]|nr:glycosyltransferase family 39 protein [Candidatus Levybacteria bacterium]
MIGIIMFFGFWFRTYKIDNPIADWHSWRQADTAAVSRNFIKDGFNPLYPQYDALNPLNETGEPNPNRYFFAEFPLYNIITYYVYLNFGIHEHYARMISVIFSTLTILFMYLLVQRYSSRWVALGAAALFAFLPYNVYYGRVTMADPLYIFFSVASLYLITKWLEKENILLMLIAAVSFSLAVLTKPYALVLLLPISYLFYRKWGVKMIGRVGMYAFLVVALAPFMLWRYHIYQHPEGMFGTTWLYNEGNIRFTGAYFRWLVYDRMSRLIFATGGFVLFWIGIVKGFSKKSGYFYYFWLASIFAFFVVIAKGNVTHDYYQMPLVPIGCIFIALGFEYLLKSGQGIVMRGINSIVAVALVLFMFSFGWYEVRGYYNINHPEIVEAGKAVDRLLPKEALVIAPYDNDSAFLYQTNRHGFTYGGDKIPKYISEGATHLVSVNFDDATNYWMQQCEILEKTDTYVIVDLKLCVMDRIVLRK